MASSIYSSLQGDGRAFRLLILEPSTDRLAPIRCKLKQASFDDGDLKYTALSYVWADPPGTTSIIVDGVETQITLNLEAALRHIRQPSCATTLWIDALCINQEDVPEKNHQVEMMREIFSGAELVIAWLGSAADDSDLAMELSGKEKLDWETYQEIVECESAEEEGPGHTGNSTINGEQEADTPAMICEGDLTTLPDQSVAPSSCLQFSSSGALTKSGVACAFSEDEDEHQDECHIIDQPGPSISQSSSTTSNSGACDSGYDRGNSTEVFQRMTGRQALALAKLMKRSWWYRAWVVQEVMLAKKVVFKCGDAEVSGGSMSSWRSFSQIMSVPVDGHENTFQSFLFLFLISSLKDPSSYIGDAKFVLFFYGMREATRPHDHIYSLLGLMSEEDRRLLGAPDYGCRVEDLFINVATKIMRKDNSLELLLAVGIPRSLAEESSTKMDLPSWVPDWTRSSMKVFTNYPGHLDVLAMPAFQFSKNMKELTFRGFEIDKIESVKSIPALSQGEMPMWQSALTTEEGTRGYQRPPPLQGLLVAMFPGLWSEERLDHETKFALVTGFFRELEEYRISLGRYEASGDHDNSVYLAGFLDWIGETRDGRTEEEILEKIFSVEVAGSFTAWYHRQSSTELQRLYTFYGFIRKIGIGSAGCSIFRTYQGSFGIMGPTAAAGDLLCVVPDCAVPLVLRKFGSSKYLLVGTSGPIPGATKGNLARAVKNGEITENSFTVV